ncbi:MAG: hypothetical protein AAF572_24045 [Cyanobacteria bacterium P01_B01_bin.77]
MEALKVSGGAIKALLSVVEAIPKHTSPMIVSLPVNTLQLAQGFEPWAG